MKFADDTKGLKEILGIQDRDDLQTVLNNLCRWAEVWGMEFNIAKCKIMHFGRNNPEYKYYMNGEELKTVNEETDVGIIIDKSLKPGKHCAKAANTASAVLRMIQRNFHYRDRHTFIKLYKQYVRPHLEFSVPAWSPWLRSDIDKLENVQKKAVKMVSGLQSKEYTARCRELGIQTLEHRRLEQDLGLVYRYMTGSGNLRSEILFEKFEERAGVRTRLAAGTNNLKVPPARTEIRRNSFAVWVITDWNNLPDHIKESNTCGKFKNALQSHLCHGGRPA
jgi:ribonucleases P/MRP protein subunit RPP40